MRPGGEGREVHRRKETSGGEEPSRAVACQSQAETDAGRLVGRSFGVSSTRLLGVELPMVIGLSLSLVAACALTSPATFSASRFPVTGLVVHRTLGRDTHTCAVCAPPSTATLAGGRLAAPAPAQDTVKTGVFTVRQTDGKTLFEVPTNLFGRDFLWHVERGALSAGLPQGSDEFASTLMIRLERAGSQVFIRNMTPSITRRSSDAPLGQDQPTSDQKIPPMARAVAEASLAPILAAIPVVSSAAGTVVFDASPLFRQDYPELGTAAVLRGAQFDPSRSYIESVRVFPRNFVIGAFVTAVPANGGPSASAIFKHSWTLLPDVPMRPRLSDNRVGLFTVGFQQFNPDSNIGVQDISYVRRYRLEKKDPNAALSEPVKPIVYYIGRTVPEKWRPYFKQAIEDWQVAFEAAGFKNAIVAKVAPSEAEDPDWDPSDTRHSVIRWVANPIKNAIGPNIADPRTGEILSAHILIWENVLELANDWYYGMCSATDKRAQKLPLSDELTGRMLRYVVAHEVGHTLGMRHNHRASTAYTVAQLRDPAFTAKHGSTASIMAYGRMNYVAQPGDGVAPESLMPRVGPYDLHAIKWSYAQLDPKTEAETLDAWADESLKNPWLAFGGEDFASQVDPRVQTQNIGLERVEATRLGMENLKIAAANLLPAYKAGASNFDGLYFRWDALLNVRYDYLASVAKEIGGREETRTDISFEPQYRAISAERQRKALRYILDEGLHYDPVFYSNGVLANAVPYNVSGDLRKYQKATLMTLFDPIRLVLLSDALLDEDHEAPFTLVEYLDTMVEGVFSEIAAGQRPNLLRRALQRDFFETAASVHQVSPSLWSEAFREGGAPSFLVEGLSSSLGTDTRSALRVALQDLDTRLTDAIAKEKDPLTRAHWTECQNAARRLLAR